MIVEPTGEMVDAGPPPVGALTPTSAPDSSPEFASKTPPLATREAARAAAWHRREEVPA